MKRQVRYLPIIALCGCWTALSLAAAQEPNQETKDSEPAMRIQAPDDWRGERIVLPPPFAPDMKFKFKGIEEIRFAPGMFQADSDTGLAQSEDVGHLARDAQDPPFFPLTQRAGPWHTSCGGAGRMATDR
jgi:hypothetical protein